MHYFIWFKNYIYPIVGRIIHNTNVNNMADKEKHSRHGRYQANVERR